MKPLDEFYTTNATSSQTLAADEDLRRQSIDWMLASSRHRYTYNFSWLGVPIIQFPQDIVALQEIIWKVKPDLIVETGIAHGGSLVFSASMLELLGGEGIVIGVDVDIREHNRIQVESHVFAKRIRMIEGSSTDPQVVRQVFDLARGCKKRMVVLDSNHTHEHVLQELTFYASLVTRGSYLVVLDTSIEDAPRGFFSDRPWGKGNNPRTALREFLRVTDRFVIDKNVGAKLLITVAPDGYLRCVKD